MNTNQNGKGTFSGPDLEQRKYRGMVKVLPTLQPPPSTFLKSSPGPAPPLSAPPNSDSTFQTNFLPDNIVHKLPVSNGNESLNTVPRLPPPPRHFKANGHRMGQLEGNNRSNTHGSVQDLRYFGSILQMLESTKTNSSSIHDRRSLNFSVQDLRAIEREPPGSQQRSARPLSFNQLSGLVPVLPTNFSNKIQNPPPQLPAQENQTFPAAAPPIIPEIRHTNNNDFSHLHDEVAQLIRELAAMKDPMREHEDWLKTQSAEMEELKDLQNQLQTNILKGKQLSETTPQHKPMQTSFALPTTSPPPLPTSPKPKAAASTMTRGKMPKPPVILPKPGSGSKINPPQPALQEKTTKQEPVTIKKEPNKTIYQNKSTDDAVVGLQSTVLTKPESTTTFSVKRMSKLFEDNADKAGRDVRGPQYTEKPKTGTIKKIAPALLKQIETAEENRIASRKVSAQTHSLKPSVFSPEESTSSSPQATPLIGEHRALPVVVKALVDTDVTSGEQLKPFKLLQAPQVPKKPTNTYLTTPSSSNSSTVTKIKLPVVPHTFSEPKVIPHNLSPPSQKPVHFQTLPSPSSNQKVLNVRPTTLTKSVSIPNLTSISSKPIIVSNLPPPITSSGHSDELKHTIVANSRFYVPLSPSDTATTFDKPSSSPKSPRVSTLPSKLSNVSNPPPTFQKPASAQNLPPSLPTFTKPVNVPSLPKLENPNLPQIASSQEPTIVPNLPPFTTLSDHSPKLNSSIRRPASCYEPVSSPDPYFTKPSPSSTLPNAPNISAPFPKPPFSNNSYSSSNPTVGQNTHSPAVEATKIQVTSTHRYENVPFEYANSDPPGVAEFKSPYDSGNVSLNHHDSNIPHEIGSYHNQVPQQYHEDISHPSPVPLQYMKNRHDGPLSGVPEGIQTPNVPSDSNMTSSKVPNLQTSTAVRPNDPPPPPPPTVQSHQTMSTASLVNNEVTSVALPLSPPVADFSQGPPPALVIQQPLAYFESNIPAQSGSSKLSISSQSSGDSATKADLMEQIRQFKESGKVLRKAATESGEGNGGTLTRGSKHEMHDALQTRFQAFCGNASGSSSDDDDMNKDEDDFWDD